MSEPSHKYQTYEIEVNTISPIHIQGKKIEYGEGMVKLNRRDDKKGRDYAYLIDNDILCEWLYELDEKNLTCVNAYAKFFSEEQVKKFNDLNRRKPYLEDFLKAYKIGNKTLLSLLEALSQDDKYFKIFKGRAFIGNKNNFIQNRKGEYYIPGSSLKGALRTAVLYSIIKSIKDKDPAWYCKNVILPVLGNVRKFINAKKDKNKLKEHFAKEIEKKIFKNFAPYDEDMKDTQGNPNDEQRDLMRIFKISDIKIRRDSLPKEEEIKVITLKGNNEPYEKYRARVECYESSETLKARMSIDIYLMERFYRNYEKSNSPLHFPFDLKNPISSIEKMLKEFAEDQWYEERKYYNKDMFHLIDNELNRSYVSKPYNCLEYGTVSNPRGDLFFTNKSRRNGTYIRDDSLKLFKDKQETLHKDKQIVRKAGQKVLYQIDKEKDGKKTFASQIFSFQYNKNSQFSRADVPFVKNLNPIKEFYDDSNIPNIRLGWGTQLLGMTIDLLLDPILRKLIRDEVLLQSIRNLPAPKSRRIVLKEKSPYKPLGWCNVVFKDTNNS